MTKDYYNILELTDEDKLLNDIEFNKKLKANYRRLSKLYHPDKTGGDSVSEEKFKNIAEAYECLSNVNSRSKYDRNQSGFNLDDIFGFNTKSNHIIKGSNIQIVVEISLNDVLNGVKKKYKYTKNKSCQKCNGVGGFNTKTCTKCNGNGRTILTGRLFNLITQTEVICSDCEGTGLQYSEQCGDCHGHGVIKTTELVDIDIPKGVHDEMVFQMFEKGNAIRGGICGDLLIKIKIQQHERFIRNGNDLIYSLIANYPQLVLGDTIEIKNINDQILTINIPEGTNIGDKIKISGEGLYEFRKLNRGDLIITIGLNVPKEYDDETKQLLLKLKEKF